MGVRFLVLSRSGRDVNGVSFASLYLAAWFCERALEADSFVSAKKYR